MRLDGSGATGGGAGARLPSLSVQEKNDALRASHGRAAAAGFRLLAVLVRRRRSSVADGSGGFEPVAGAEPALSPKFVVRSTRGF